MNELGGLFYSLSANWDKKSLSNIENGFKNVSSSFLNAIAISSTAMAGMLAGMTAINDKTAEMANLADTVGLSFNTAFGLGSSVKDIGLNFQNVIDLSEEMNNKIGESKQKYEDWLKTDKGKGKKLKLVGGVEDAFKGLDFSIVDEKFKKLNMEQKFKKFAEMDSEKQFKLVLDTASLMEDSQKAVSMVDILMGGEANKILGHLRKQKTTLSALIKEKNKLNFLDKEGLKGAKAFSAAFKETTSIFSTISQELSGIIGQNLVPILKNMSEWFKINKEIIQTDLKGWINGISKAFRFMIDLVISIIDHLGGMKNIIIGIGAVIAIWNAPLLLTVGAVFLALMAFDDLMSFIEGKDSVIGDLFTSATESVNSFASDAMDSITNFGTDMYQTFLDLVQKIKDLFLNLDIVGVITGQITNAKKAISSFTSSFSLPDISIDGALKSLGFGDDTPTKQTAPATNNQSTTNTYHINANVNATNKSMSNVFAELSAPSGF